MRAALVLVVCLTSPAFADPATPLPRHRWAADGLFVVPLDTYGEDADFGLGLLGRYEYRMGSKLHLTGRAGPVLHDASRDGHGLFMFLAMAGMRYNLDPDQETGTFFTMAFGLNYVRVSAAAMGVRATDAEPELAIDLGGGFQFRRVQVRGTVFYTPHVGASFGGDAVSYLGLALTLGYDFAVR